MILGLVQSQVDGSGLVPAQDFLYQPNPYQVAPNQFQVAPNQYQIDPNTLQVDPYQYRSGLNHHYQIAPNQQYLYSPDRLYQGAPKYGPFNPARLPFATQIYSPNAYQDQNNAGFNPPRNYEPAFSPSFLIVPNYYHSYPTGHHHQHQPISGLVNQQVNISPAVNKQQDQILPNQNIFPTFANPQFHSGVFQQTAPLVMLEPNRLQMVSSLPEDFSSFGHQLINANSNQLVDAAGQQFLVETPQPNFLIDSANLTPAKEVSITIPTESVNQKQISPIVESEASGPKLSLTEFYELHGYVIEDNQTKAVEQQNLQNVVIEEGNQHDTIEQQNLRVKVVDNNQPNSIEQQNLLMKVIDKTHPEVAVTDVIDVEDKDKVEIEMKEKVVENNNKAEILQTQEMVDKQSQLSVEEISSAEMSGQKFPPTAGEIIENNIKIATQDTNNVAEENKTNMANVNEDSGPEDSLNESDMLDGYVIEENQPKTEEEDKTAFPAEVSEIKDKKVVVSVQEIDTENPDKNVDNIQTEMVMESPTQEVEETKPDGNIQAEMIDETSDTVNDDERGDETDVPAFMDDSEDPRALQEELENIALNAELEDFINSEFEKEDDEEDSRNLGLRTAAY